MERTDWLNAGLDSADARFLMLTAITHHRFTSPAWGEHEVRSSTTNSPSSTRWPSGRSATTARPGRHGPGRASADRAVVATQHIFRLPAVRRHRRSATAAGFLPKAELSAAGIHRILGR